MNSFHYAEDDSIINTEHFVFSVQLVFSWKYCLVCIFDEYWMLSNPWEAQTGVNPNPLVVALITQAANI